jgi:hypothetical protein
MPEMVTITGPWATPDHPERLLLQAWPSTAGMVRFIESVHADLLAVLSDAERERLGLLRDGASLKNMRHDDLARIIWFCLLAHEYLLGETLAGRAVADVRSAMFPDNLKIVHAGYRESAGRAAARIALLTPERNLVLANIPVQGSNMLNLTFEWNQVGVEMGEIQDQRVTPAPSAGERVTRRNARARWIRALKGMMSTLRFEAEERPEAARILERIAGIQAEVRRRLRAGSGAPDGDDDVEDGPDEGDDATGEPGDDHDALPATESR